MLQRDEQYDQLKFKGPNKLLNLYFIYQKY
jgi:hypothetical protein